MTGSIYLIHSNGELVEMKETSYDSEDILQELIAKYPNLLAGDQIDSVNPRRWLLINREFGLSDEENKAPRWSIDHLFLDQDGIPTIVETKRADDTRIRREVAGQMLDYAANAIVYWPIETIISEFQTRCEKEDYNPETLLNEFLQNSMDANTFWEQAKTNLKAGKIRLVWVSDNIPKELRRIIEFLNEQMDPAQAIGIEVKMFSGQGLKTMVPRVINPMTQQHVASSSGKKWTEEEFFTTIISKQSQEASSIARKLLDWAKVKKLNIYWGTGKIDGSFIPIIKSKEEEAYPIVVSTNGRIYIQFYVLKTRIAFKDEVKRLELLKRLNSIEGISFSNDSIERMPSFPIKDIKEEKNFNQFIDTLNWIVDEIKTSPNIL
jgi:hypothetical protein